MWGRSRENYSSVSNVDIILWVRFRRKCWKEKCWYEMLYFCSRVSGSVPEWWAWEKRDGLVTDAGTHAKQGMVHGTWILRNMKKKENCLINNIGNHVDVKNLKLSVSCYVDRNMILRWNVSGLRGETWCTRHNKKYEVLLNYTHHKREVFWNVLLERVKSQEGENPEAGREFLSFPEKKINCWEHW